MNQGKSMSAAARFLLLEELTGIHDVDPRFFDKFNTFFPATVVPCEENGVFEPGGGDALYSFGPVSKATEWFWMILGALESGEAPL